MWKYLARFLHNSIIIRPLVPDDAEAAFRWCGDPSVNDDRYLPSAEKLEVLKTALRKELDLFCK
jgi:hypothetical protein